MTDTVVVVSEEAPDVLEVISAGPQGPQGPQGVKGDVGDVNPAMNTILADAQTARNQAQTAATSAQTSATAAGTAQTAAQTAQTAAETARTGAETAQTAAETAQTAAAGSASSALSSATTATQKASDATNAATSASLSATTATTQAGVATTKASEAVTSASNAASSASSALASKNAAATSETNAATSAATATTKATEAGTSANAAAASASAAAASATTAGTKATDAANSASQAAATASTIGTAANTAAAQAAIATSKATDATNAATAAANSATAAASSATTATNWGTSAQTSAATATTKAAEAFTSAANAASSASAAATSANTATTQANLAITSASNAATSEANAATTAAGLAASVTASQNAAAASATQSANSATASAASATQSANSATASANSATASASGAASSTAKASEAAASAAAIQATFGSAASLTQAVQTAQAQASLAQGYAASASSVVSQDLSAVTAQALHRSPNAITAMAIYDTSKDSDGGAWTKKCQQTSWYNEALAGKWLGAQESEINARYVGASLGAERVTNGDFSVSTGWTSTNVTIANGVASFVGASTYKILFQTLATITDGTLCQVNYTVSSLTTSGTLRPRIDSNNGINRTIAAVGTYTEYIIKNGAGVLAFETGGSNTFVGNVDNISVKAVTAINTASNDYFQLTTDGKFYRLWSNLATYSDAIESLTWTNVGGAPTFSVSAIAAPSSRGGGFLRKVIPANGATNTTTSITVPVGVPVTVSFLAQAAELDEWQLRDGGSNVLAKFNAANGTFTLNSSTSASITLVSGSMYLCVCTYTPVNNALRLHVEGTTHIATNGTDGLLIGALDVRYGTAAGYEAKAVNGSTSETFRGNKADFPRLAAIVAEAASVTIYDLTEPGRPMWLRFATNTSSVSMMALVNTGNNLAAVAAREGLLVVGGGGSANGWIGTLVDFVSERVQYVANGVAASFAGNIAARNSALGRVSHGGYGTLTGLSANAIAMTVLPDAPVDPVTGLRVPTIAVATDGGVSVIRQDGTVQSQAFFGGSARSVRFDGRRVLIGAITPGAFWGAYVWDLSDNSTQDYGVGSVVKLDPNTGTRQVRTVGQNYAALQGRAELRLLRHNKTPSRSILARVANSFNTGWMAGDIRRCFLSDTEVGALTPLELLTNGGFSNGLTGWVPLDANTSVDASSGAAVFSSPSGFRSLLVQTVPSVPGRAYRITFDKVSGPLLTNPAMTVRVWENNWGSAQIFNREYGLSAAGTYEFFVIATTNAIVVGFDLAAGNTGVSFTVDNVSVREALADRSYRAAGAFITGTLTRAQLASGTSLVGFSGFSAANYLREPYSADLDFGTGEWTASAWVNVPTANAAAATIFDRAAASGARITLGIDATNKLTATAFDGTTTRTVTTSAAYNTAQWLKARVNYTTDGTLAILVNGREVAATRGAPLLTLNNASAVLTIGNSFALDAPFPGSIALLKLGATVPTPEQATFMFEQEKQLFRAGALSVLPDSGAIVDMAYDDATDRWVAISAANESYWTGLVRNSVQAVPAGSFSRVVAGSGLELAARTGTNSGVDVTIPPYALREELVKRAEAAARLSKELAIYDYVGGFTANTTSGSTAITNVSTITYPASYIGARISGTGIPANTTIVAVSGSTLYLSAAATATATGVSISFLDFELPAGMEAKTVLSAGAVKQEGATKDYTRLYDGFIETIRFGVAPGATAWVQIQAQRITLQ